MKQINTINEEIEHCVICPFQEYRYNEVKELGFGSFYKIMFIGICPAQTSNKTQGFSSFDEYFNRLLLKVEITKEDYYFTNLCKTSIPTGVILTQSQEKHCLSHLLKEIQVVKPQIIVLLGRPVRSAFQINWPETISYKIFGKEKKQKIPIYSIKHPGYLKYKPEEENDYLVSLKKIFKFYKKQLF